MTLITNQSVVCAGGVVVLPKFLAKGMEFDAVYVMTDGTYDGSMVTRHAHYIACTRALHELYVLDVSSHRSDTKTEILYLEIFFGKIAIPTEHI